MSAFLLEQLKMYLTIPPFETPVFNLIKLKPAKPELNLGIFHIRGGDEWELL